MVWICLLSQLNPDPWLYTAHILQIVSVFLSSRKHISAICNLSYMETPLYIYRTFMWQSILVTGSCKTPESFPDGISKPLQHKTKSKRFKSHTVWTLNFCSVFWFCSNLHPRKASIYKQTLWPSEDQLYSKHCGTQMDCSYQTYRT